MIGPSCRAVVAQARLRLEFLQTFNVSPRPSYDRLYRQGTFNPGAA